MQKMSKIAVQVAAPYIYSSERVLAYGTIHVHTHTYTHTSVRVHVYACACVCVCASKIARVRKRGASSYTRCMCGVCELV